MPWGRLCEKGDHLAYFWSHQPRLQTVALSVMKVESLRSSCCVAVTRLTSSGSTRSVTHQHCTFSSSPSFPCSLWMACGESKWWSWVGSEILYLLLQIIPASLLTDACNLGKFSIFSYNNINILPKCYWNSHAAFNQVAKKIIILRV